jgi:hypothetical protein
MIESILFSVGFSLLAVWTYLRLANLNFRRMQIARKPLDVDLNMDEVQRAVALLTELMSKEKIGFIEGHMAMRVLLEAAEANGLIVRASKKPFGKPELVK